MDTNNAPANIKHRSKMRGYFVSFFMSVSIPPDEMSRDYAAKPCPTRRPSRPANQRREHIGDLAYLGMQRLGHWGEKNHGASPIRGTQALVPSQSGPSPLLSWTPTEP